MTPISLLRLLMQSHPADAFLCPRFGHGFFETVSLMGFCCHVGIIGLNLDTVKIDGGYPMLNPLTTFNMTV